MPCENRVQFHGRTGGASFQTSAIGTGTAPALVTVDDSIPSGGSTTTRGGLPVDPGTPNLVYRVLRQ